MTSVQAESVQPADRYDARLARQATGLLRQFNAAGVLSAADVHVAIRLGRLGGEADDRILLAGALAVRGARLGSVCLDLAQVRYTVTVDDPAAAGLAASLAGLPWPPAAEWLAACHASPLVAVGVAGDPWRPLRLVDGLLYLDRYWRQEEQVRFELDTRAARTGPGVDPVRLESALRRLFPGEPPDRQRLAAAACAAGWVTVLAGGPGTGKTTAVAAILALLRDQPGEAPRVALAAPTGKAAARLQEAVRAQAAQLSDRGDQERFGEPSASTLHRLLGSKPDSRSRFVHDRHNRLPHDVVVVDETSMVSLTLMSRLLEAVRPDARLILVGDPDQLASVEAGAVLGDLVARPVLHPRPLDGLPSVVAGDLAPEAADDYRRGVVRLTRNFRYGGAIGALAEAVRRGDADAVLALLAGPAPELAFLETDGLGGQRPAGLDELRADVVTAGRELTAAARIPNVGRALDLLDRHRLLCAHRHGPYGVTRWSAEVERWLSGAIEGYAAEGMWYRGRPVLVTANDYDLKLYNGDTGVVVDGGVPSELSELSEHGVRAAFGRGAAATLVSPSRLSAVQTVHAMTVHRSQGSQFERVSVLLPPAESPLLTRELFYTAITRATARVRVVGSAQAVRAAVERPVVRASGLRRRWTA